MHLEVRACSHPRGIVRGRRAGLGQGAAAGFGYGRAIGPAATSASDTRIDPVGGPYEKDGSVFGNRERLLPASPRGYYREYTVKTPGAKNRGARRIVCGGKPPTRPEACFYTADHYASFQRIAP
jgi:ribonuclease